MLKDARQIYFVESSTKYPQKLHDRNPHQELWQILIISEHYMISQINDMPIPSKKWDKKYDDNGT